MIIDKVELINVEMPLISPFRTSFGETYKKNSILVKVYSEGIIGWGDVPPFLGPFYSYETIKTAWHILKDYVIPTLLYKNIETVDDLLKKLLFIRGHNFAKSGIEMAYWELETHRQGIPLNKLLGGTREKIQVGASLGIKGSIKQLLEDIEKSLDMGYQRIKIKIEPRWDVDVVKEIRKNFSNIHLMVDANSAYDLRDLDVFLKLDAYNLMMIEQPLSYDDLFDHAELQKKITTPICLDESIHSFEAAKRAIQLGSCKIINIKPGRVGGLYIARQIHDLCLDNNIPVWCGGMIESGIGQCKKVEISALPNFTLPNDIEMSGRYLENDLIEPPLYLNKDGTVDVDTCHEGSHFPCEKAISKYTVEKLVVE